MRRCCLILLEMLYPVTFAGCCLNATVALSLIALCSFCYFILSVFFFFILSDDVFL